MASVPFVERYRPVLFDHIVLDPTNHTLLHNMIRKRYMANVLLYGPPGTGKTTTIMNMIELYQKEVEGGVNTERVIQLNASDERGIEIIRGTILQFVTSNSLFHPGMKFVVLDEVDYMTKNAQQALKHLIQETTRPPLFSTTEPSREKGVRFCLICNYISKIEPGLLSECLAIPFHRLPPEHIHSFLQHISDNEALGLTHATITHIQKWFQSDMRSMINFIQSNLMEGNNMRIMDDTVWVELKNLFIRSPPGDRFKERIHDLSIQYNMDKKTILKEFLDYLVQDSLNQDLDHDHDHKGSLLSNPLFFEFVETLLHSPNTTTDTFVSYAIFHLRHLLTTT